MRLLASAGIGSGRLVFSTQIRDAMVVRRAVTLGLPVCLVGLESHEPDSVANDYRRLAAELIEPNSTA